MALPHCPNETYRLSTATSRNDQPTVFRFNANPGTLLGRLEHWSSSENPLRTTDKRSMAPNRKVSYRQPWNTAPSRADRRIKRVASTGLAGRIHVRNLELTEMHDQLLLGPGHERPVGLAVHVGRLAPALALEVAGNFGVAADGSSCSAPLSPVELLAGCSSAVMGPAASCC
jgi:hypothetical protein